MNQRWRDGDTKFVKPSTCFDPSEFDVAEIPGDKIAKAFVMQHHYSGSYPAARYRFGLYRRGELCGVSVFSHPCRDDVLTNVFPGTPTDSVELGRFVLLDDSWTKEVVPLVFGKGAAAFGVRKTTREAKLDEDVGTLALLPRKPMTIRENGEEPNE